MLTGRFASLAAEFQTAAAEEPIDLARAALIIAKLEYPDLDPAPSLAKLAELASRTAAALEPLAEAPASMRLAVVAEQLFDEEGFAGNRGHYDDYRNSLLNQVLDRKLGIPITLALVFLEVAKRAGVRAHGVSFPGHFLVRGVDDEGDRPLILDPFNGGRALGESDLRALLSSAAGDDVVYTEDLLRPCSSRQLLARMLNNLKRTYVELRSFPQAYAATNLILAVDPTLLSELRDRGLLAYHLDDYTSALRDLEDFVKLHAWTDESNKEERDQIWTHIKNLRRRVAGFN
jgi:regulator of sirC expression with transglutaminase-like and TPR domain